MLTRQPAAGAAQPGTSAPAPAPAAPSGTIRRLGFQSMREEVRHDALRVEGALPGWLGGTLVRVTPAELEIGGRTTRHWFDGLAMLNAFTFKPGGAVGYASRFLDSEVKRASDAGRADFLGFANDPCRALFKRVAALFDKGSVNDNCNVNVTRLGERYIAMTEVPLPMAFDADTLATEGLVRWQDDLKGDLTTAHPHRDPASGELVNYLARIGPRVTYRITSTDGAPRRRLVAELKRGREVAYMHSFALTEHYVVLAEFPYRLNPLHLLTERPRPLIHHFRWRPDQPTRFLVADRASGRLVREAEGPGFFAFHHVNAWEEGDALVLDIVTHENGPTAIEALEVQRLRDPQHGIGHDSRLHRYRVPLGGGAVTDELLSDTVLELPRIRADRNTRPYRYLYAPSLRAPDSDWFDRLVKLDLASGERREWTQEGTYPGEGVFVPAPGSETEDDGVVLSIVLDARAGRSFLLVLDAHTFTERARAEVPHHLPFNFHMDHFGD